MAIFYIKQNLNVFILDLAYELCETLQNLIICPFWKRFHDKKNKWKRKKWKVLKSIVYNSIVFIPTVNDMYWIWIACKVGKEFAHIFNHIVFRFII